MIFGVSQAPGNSLYLAEALGEIAAKNHINIVITRKPGVLSSASGTDPSHERG